MPWLSVSPSDDEYPIGPGLYRASVSVSRNLATAKVAGYLRDHGWTLVNLWEPGEPLPGDWPAEASTEPEENHRLLRGHALYQGQPTSIGVKAPWPFTFYRLAAVWRWQDPERPTQEAPNVPKLRGRSAPIVLVVGAVALGFWVLKNQGHRAGRRSAF